MAAGYAKVNEELAAAGYPRPVLLRQHRLIYDRLSTTGRGSFDKKYLTEMVAQQNDAVRLFQQEADGGRVASLKQLAAGMLATMQQHLALANQTAGAVGADVTGTAIGAR